MSKDIFIIDFDSTFIKAETLDILGEISLAAHPEKAKKLKEIADITNSGMNGDSSFAISLEKRISILQANELHLEELIKRVKKVVSTSVERNKSFFKDFSKQIFIVSSGFKEFIVPVAVSYTHLTLPTTSRV